MSGRIFFPPVIGAILVLFLVLMFITAPLLILGLIGRTLSRFGLSLLTFFGFLALSLLGSMINLPVLRYRTTQPVVSIKYAYYFGIPYPVQSVENRPAEGVVSINVGGAVLPLILSLYLLLMNPETLLPSALAVPIVSILIYFVARPVKGLGIVTPMFVPPIIAAIVAILVGGSYAPVVAYVGGTLGTLIGADLFHIGSIKSLGAPNVSIGGAGTFDGIFLTGLLAALLA